MQPTSAHLSHSIDSRYYPARNQANQGNMRATRATCVMTIDSQYNLVTRATLGQPGQHEGNMSATRATSVMTIDSKTW